MPPQRFQFTIDPKTPLKDLLPVPPQTNKPTIAAFAIDLSKVPEVQFQAPLAKTLGNDEATKRTAHMIARINHLNGQKIEGFLEALKGQRADLTGLPFAMGDACRTKGEQSRQFAHAVALVRTALQDRSGRQNAAITSTFRIATPTVAPTPVTAEKPAAATPAPTPVTPQPVPTEPVPAQTGQFIEQLVEVVSDGSVRVASSPRVSADTFWEQFREACAQEDKTAPRADRCQLEQVTLARIAALMQVLAPESPAMRLGLIKYLSAISHAEATRSLARLAIFSGEEDVRSAAIDALKVRRERDYTEVLVQGLHYPWPKVASRAAEAIVKLERADLVPQLLDLLEAPDPRAPVFREVDQKPVALVRELVRINHHRNCLLCHAPGNTGNVAPEVVTAAVPIPSEALPVPSDGYRTNLPDLQVRVDVTYLRQDFSLLQPVADAHPWPEMQRFDYLVRSRELTPEEAKEYQQKLTPDQPGRSSPYHRVALAALRELTGRDAEPTPEAWRRLLQLPGPKQPTTALR
jgi:hypothetical protein